MITKRRKNKREAKESAFLTLIMGVAVFGIAGILIVSNIKINQKRNQMEERVVELRAQLQELQEKRQQLRAQVSSARDDEYLEEEARENFNLQKPGEEAVTVIPPENSQGPLEKGRGWLDSLREFLFNLF